MKRIGLWILGLVLLPLVFGLILFGLYGLGELTPSIVVTVPFGLLGRDLKEHFQGKSDKTIYTIWMRFFLMPLILFAWLSPVVAFNVLWKTFLFELEGTTTISFFGISIPGVEPGPVFDYLAGFCGIAFAVWVVIDSATLMRRRIRMMDNTETTPLNRATTGRGEFTGTARAMEDKSAWKTKSSSKDAEDITVGNGIQPLLLRRVTEGKSKVVDTVLNRFYLEDGDSKILVDPRGATFFDPGDAMPAARETPHIIMLTRNVMEDELTSGAKRSTIALLPGDRVYLFGMAKHHAKEGLIVRPVKDPRPAGLLNRFLFNLDRQMESLDPRNMFILADGNEELVKSLLRAKIRSIALFSLIWAVPATILLVVLMAGVKQ